MTGIAPDPGRPPRSRWSSLTWTPTFILFLAYVGMILTYRLPGATAAMGAALLSLFLQPTSLRVPKFLWVFAAWFAWASVGYALTPYPDEVWASLIDFGKVFLVTLVAVNALRTTTQIRLFMLFVVVSYVLFPVRSALHNYAIGYTRFGRAIASFIYENPNDLAAITLLVLGPALALCVGESRRSWWRWIGLACVAPLVVTIVLTQSRGALLALGAIVLPSGVALARRRPRVVPAFAALIGLALYLAPDALWERLAGLAKVTRVETIAEMDPEGSAGQRFALLHTAVRIIADHPLLGVGLGEYPRANAEYSPALGPRDTHNTYLNIAAETGLPGLVLFLVLVASVLRRAGEIRRRADHASLTHAETLRWLQYGLIAYLIAGVFGSFARLTFPYIFLGLLWSASQAIGALCPPRSPPEPSPPRADPAPTTLNRRPRGEE